MYNHKGTGRANQNLSAQERKLERPPLPNVPGAFRQGDKGPNNAQPDQKGRDASGASSGAEALIASSVKLNL